MLFEAITGRFFNRCLELCLFDRVVLILLCGFITTGLAVPFVVGASRVVTLERLDFLIAAACTFAPVFPSTQRHNAAR
jgi:hypothetical protein